MPEHQDQERADRAKVQHAQRSVAPAKAAEQPAEAPAAGLPANPRSLLADARLRGRGNEQVRIALMREMQQSYGNRAVQRYLRQTEAPRETAQATPPVQTQQAVAPARPAVQTQQAVAPAVARRARSLAPVQRGFFGKVWGGIKKGAKAVGHAVVGAASWVGERMRDAAMWVVNLVRDLPERLARLAVSLWEGLKGVVTFIPEAIQALAHGGMRGLADWLWDKAKAGGAWVLTFLSRVFDLRGGPEVVEFLFHLFSHASPLTGPETAAGSSVLGPTAVRWGDVRVAEGGFLKIVFHFNDARAFTTFHTINMTAADRAQLDIVVHELTHVDQYEKVGSLYLGQAIHAQATIGYGYGGAAGLTADRAAGKHYRDYNREQQAQIAQDYYKIPAGTPDQATYQPFIDELRRGEL